MEILSVLLALCERKHRCYWRIPHMDSHNKGENKREMNALENAFGVTVIND